MTARLLLAVVALAACGSKKSNEAPPPPPAGSAQGSGSGSGSGSGEAAAPVEVKVVPLVWKTPAGEPLLALNADGSIDGPCGAAGKLSGNAVVVGAQTLVWTGVERKGKTYQVQPLPWTISIDDAGAVTLKQTGKPDVPLGSVTGTETEDGQKLFAALVIAAPTMQIKLSFVSTDGKDTLELVGSADLDAWVIKEGTKVLASKKRDQPATPAPAFTEAADGTVSAPKVIGRLVGRAKCAPHDKAAAALIQTYLAR